MLQFMHPCDQYECPCMVTHTLPCSTKICNPQLCCHECAAICHDYWCLYMWLQSYTTVFGPIDSISCVVQVWINLVWCVNWPCSNRSLAWTPAPICVNHAHGWYASPCVACMSMFHLKQLLRHVHICTTPCSCQALLRFTSTYIFTSISHLLRFLELTLLTSHSTHSHTLRKTRLQSYKLVCTWSSTTNSLSPITYHCFWT